MRRVGFFSSKICFLCILLLMGCGSPKVKVNVTADQALNQDNQQRSLPVVLRVYQLKDKTKFEQANFKQIWKQDAALLGNELLAREEYLVQPGKKGQLKILKQEGAQYIGVVALFRDNTQNHWRILKPLTHSLMTKRFSNSVTLEVKDKSIQMAS